MKTAVLLISHGSRVAEANESLNKIADMVQEMSSAEFVEVAFRERQQPDIQAGIDACVARGAQRILLYPYFLFAGAHVLRDLPDEMARAGQRHRGLEMVLGKPLGVDRRLAEVVCTRIGETLADSGWELKE
ncbi:sirohydrochlorin cobaltochelatase [Geothermobacter hydrogeniphilus]|uniref:Sirohydrochlorin cobaltochelatase n=1 Tax=Geothermobacter hydrogeniphilus TaxID=1969733 RepID=A0A2K2H6H3_9BACT|nr:CbiX/SirB N-terminal domain-containing protein [Geothermobacter hydrogeniphilus]PNU18849.1 sirohydrochlorin cobaltochelatase [Geothermobacter hydrogeniphilus]